MRQRLVLIALLASTASAAPKAGKDPKAELIDVKPMLEKLEVFKDELGRFFVAPRPDAASEDDASLWVFAGDQKGLYQQRIIGTSHHDKIMEWSIWAPRVRHIQQASVTQTDKGATLICEMRDSKYVEKPLVQLPADQAKAFLLKTPLHPPLWQRVSHLLGRDDDGVYYFVDELRAEYGGHGYRVFIGQKGAMKEVAMKNVVSDSAGEIFATASGDLKIVTGEKGKAYWKKGGKKEDLTLLEPQDNRYLIYSELGIYGTIGTVCDDQ